MANIISDLGANGNIPRLAINEAAKANLPGKDGGPYDAYRHLLWTAEMTRRYGETIARIVATGHEIEGDLKGQTADRRAMDERNNEIGFDIGKDAKSWEQVVDRARRAIDAGISGNGPATWLPTNQWRHSDVDPNPAPRDGTGNPIPPSRWNWPTATWPSLPYPIPPSIPTPPPSYPRPPSGVPYMPDGYYEYYRRPEFNREFRRGTNWRQPSDPLILDLDGDGVELTTGDSAVLFDHNKDNIRTGTQWVKPDDGILVRDLNGNGLIDSGRELFGDQTELPAGYGNVLGTGGSGSGQGTLGTGLGGLQLATNGWQALAALDSNRDGVINSSDAAFAELKVWRDLNQDGISQTDELQTLGQAGVSSINLAAANQSTGSYTTSAGTTRTAQNIDFTTNNFYSEFTDNPPVTASAAQLPQLQGAGFVRDMREAMSLGTAQSQTLAQTITSFKAATTAQDRQALVDQVITAWANTSSMGDAKARNPMAANSLLSSGSWYVNSAAQAIADFAQSQPALYAQLSALERFNGQSVIERYTRVTNASYYDAATKTYKGYTFYAVSIEPQRLPFFQTAYDSLKASTYQSLYLQTEGKELLKIQNHQTKRHYQYRSYSRTNLLVKNRIRHPKTSYNAHAALLCM